ncbi:MAG: ABC transporter ATP-binding protein [Pseudomonadota bacterium]
MIKAEHLRFCYPGHDEPIIENCSFTLGKGEVMAILGQNGSGKTTLIRLLLGLLMPQAGNLRTKGRLSYVPQEAQIPFDYPVREVVLMGACARNGIFATPRRRDYQRTDDILRKVGLAGRGSYGFSRLSGGQKQMAMIARALVCDPDVIVMDEPTSALDYRNQDKVLLSMAGMAAEGKAVVFTTHCPSQALNVADRVILVGGDTGIQHGTADDILTANTLSALYQMPIRRHRTADGEIVFPKYSSIKQ